MNKVSKSVCAGFLSGALVLQLIGCSGGQESVTANNELSKSYKNQEVVMEKNEDSFHHAYTEFGMRLASFAKEENENLLISPLSLITALGMTANGAANHSLEEMEQVLYEGYSRDEMTPQLAYYCKNLPSTKKAKFEQANSIWIRDDIDVKDSFLECNGRTFQSEVYQAVFDESTKQMINDWTKKKTHDMIPQILDKIDKEVAMYLINANAFEGEWKEPFEEYRILKKQDFTRGDGTVDQVDMLCSTENGYFHDEDTIGFKKDYAEGYSFVAFLPTEEVDMSTYLQEWNGDKWMQLMDSIDYNPDIDVQIPKFSATYEIEASKYLQEMGMVESTTEGLADFSDMSEIDKMYISRVIHKTYLELDEKGTKAAAVTAVEMKCESARIEESELIEIHLDRPFVYAIIDQENQLPVFFGVQEHF